MRPATRAAVCAGAGAGAPAAGGRRQQRGGSMAEALRPPGRPPGGGVAPEAAPKWSRAPHALPDNEGFGQVMGKKWLKKESLNDDLAEMEGTVYRWDLPINSRDDLSGAGDIRKDFALRIKALHTQFVSSDGVSVDYDTMGRSQAWQEYKQMMARLIWVDLVKTGELERRAFFINMFNMLTMHGLVDHIQLFGSNFTFQDTPNERERAWGVNRLHARFKLYKRFWMGATTSYRVAQGVLSLNDIEHGILRDNRPPSLPFAIAPFDDGESPGYRTHPKTRPWIPRTKEECMDQFLAPPARTLSGSIAGNLEPDTRPKLRTPLDPRIHFALNRGSRSCPRIRFYEAARLDDQLDQAAEDFIERGGGAEVVPDWRGRPVLVLSPVFRWYLEDFGGAEGVVALLRRYTNRPEVAAAATLAGPAGGIRWDMWDWSLNSFTATAGETAEQMEDRKSEEWIVAQKKFYKVTTEGHREQPKPDSPEATSVGVSPKRSMFGETGGANPFAEPRDVAGELYRGKMGYSR